MLSTVKPSALPRCERCGGQMYGGYDGEQTCLWCGEVSYPPPPPLYTGDDLVVGIRSLPDRELVAVLHPKDGRFRIDLEAGYYRVRAFVRDGGACWEDDVKNVRVVQDQVTRVRLSVYNACIL
jgi:hypothetical protein